MKYLIILLILLSSCMSNNLEKKSISKEKNLFDMNIDEYKKMLINYNKNNNYPKIDY